MRIHVVRARWRGGLRLLRQRSLPVPSDVVAMTFSARISTNYICARYTTHSVIVYMGVFLGLNTGILDTYCSYYRYIHA